MIQFLPLIGEIINKVIPDKEKQAEAQLKLVELQQSGDLKELEAAVQRDVEQIALNKVEAQSPSFFKSAWRPFIGWTCGVGFAYAVIIYPVMTWVAVVFNVSPPPNIEADILFPVMMGLLGLGGMRSFEKFKGITK